MNKELRKFEKFAEKYKVEDKLFPKSEYIKDYAGGSREFFGTEVIEAYLESIKQLQPTQSEAPLLNKLAKALMSLKMSMNAHPDYYKGGEFKDMVSLADQVLIEYKKQEEEGK